MLGNEKLTEDWMIDYHWPNNGKIIPDYNQKLTSTFMVHNPHSFIFNQPGCGKTLSALWASDFIMSHFPRGKVKALIMAPLSTLNSVWEKEIKTHLFGSRTCTVVYGSAEKRARMLGRKVDFYIMNFDGVKVDSVRKILEQRPDIKIIIIDEATAFSANNTERHKLARDLVQIRPYVWAMSGTPLIRGHMAAHGQARLVHAAYQESFTAFKQRTMFRAGGFRWEPLPIAYPSAMELLQPAIRIPRRAFHSIPPAVPVPYEIPFTTAQARLYKELKREFVASVGGPGKGAQISAVHEGVLRLKLLQIACGCVYDDKRTAHPIDAAPRLAQLWQIIQEAEGKVIIFAPFTGALKHVYHYLKPKIDCALVIGETGLKARSKIFKDFEETDSPQVICADPGTMAHGLTLVSASVVVWYGPTDKAELYVQANQRIDRPGQKRNTYIVQFMSSPVEKEIYRRLHHNVKMDGAMMKLLERDE